MRLNSFFSLFLCVVALSTAIPIPAPGGQKTPSNIDKGKANELTPSPGQSPPGSPSPPGSGSHTPTPSEDSDVPLPGRHGVHLDTKKNVATLHYGDDLTQKHMEHVQLNQETHPENARPMALASDQQHVQNRKDALRGIPSGVKHPVTGEPLVRDEKQLAMLDNPNHGSTTTVQHRPESESHIEGGMTSKLKSVMKEHGAKGQLRANPGFLPLSPDQRIAHEAPARLNTQTLRPSDPNAAAKKKPKTKPDPKIKEEEEKRKAAGYTPVTQSGMPLRHRPGQEEPSKPVKKDAAKPAGSLEKTNLVQEKQLPPGQRWKPNEAGASHAGAPPPNKDSETRQPPRPQNIEAHRNRPKEPTAPSAGENKPSGVQEAPARLGANTPDRPPVQPAGPAQPQHAPTSGQSSKSDAGNSAPSKPPKIPKPKKGRN